LSFSSSSSSSTTFIGKATERTELPPVSLTARVARKSPTSLSFTLKWTSLSSTWPERSK